MQITYPKKVLIYIEKIRKKWFNNSQIILINGEKMEQKYILKNCKSFKVKDIFDCG